MWERDPASMDRALQMHDEVVLDEAGRWGGTVVKHTGDGMFVVFVDAIGGVRCAVAAQRRLLSARWPDGAELAVRMGLHRGEAMARLGDYFGPDPNRCARIVDVARGGQILVSNAVRAACDDEMSSLGLDLVAIGERRLRGLSAPEQLAELRGPGLTDGPRRSDRDLLAPLPLVGGLVGRDGAVEQVSTLLATERLVTLVGPAGVGKTRLAVEVASRAHGAEQRTDVAYVDLGSAGSDVTAVVATALGVRAAEGESVVEGVARIAGLDPLLVVLDNAEHVVGPVRRVVDELVRGGAHVRMLVTSQLPLDLPVEQVVAVAPLDVGTREPGPAMVLFEARVQAHDPAFRLDDARDAVRSICGALDGLPLAIELAAARTRTFGLDEIRSRLARGLGVLGSANDATTDRRSTVRSAIDWSYQLLDDSERRVFRRLGVFAASFDLEQLVGVVADDAVSEAVVLDVLDQLVRRSLVQVTSTESGVRYALLQPIRAFALEQLDAGSERDDLSRRHATYHLGLLARGAGLGVSDLDRIDLAAADVRAALAGAVASDPDGAAQLLLDGHAALRSLGWQENAAGWLADVLARATVDDRARGRLHLRHGQMCFASGTDLAAGRRTLEDGLATAERAKDAELAGRLRLELARSLSLFPASLDVAAAQAHLALLEAAELAPATRAQVDNVAALLSLYGSRNSEGVDRAASSRSAARDLGRTALASNSLALHGAHLAYRGQIAEGLSEMEAAWAEGDRAGDPLTTAVACWLRGYASVLLMDPADAARWLGREIATGRADSVPAVRRSILANLGIARCLMGDTAGAQEAAPEQLRLNGTLLEPLLAYARGEPHRARDVARDRLVLLAERGDRNEQTALELWLGRFSRAVDDLDGARHHLASGLALLADGDGSPYYEVPIRAELVLCGADDHLERAVELVDRHPLRGLAGRVRLAEAVVADDGALAERRFEDALRIATAHRCVWDRIDALMLRSISRRRRGDERSADEDDARVRELVAATAG